WTEPARRPAHRDSPPADSPRSRVPADSVEKKREETVGEGVRVGTRREPRVRPVGGREKGERGGIHVEIRTELSEVPPLAEELTNALLVATALVDDLLEALALEVLPFLDEDRRDVELLRDDAQMGAESEPHLLRRRCVVGNRVERAVEGGRAAAHRLVEQVLLALDVGVERALLHAHRVGQVADRGAVVALLGEQAGRLAGKLFFPAHRVPLP